MNRNAITIFHSHPATLLMCALQWQPLQAVRSFAADAKPLDELRKPKFSSKYLIQHVSQRLM